MNALWLKDWTVLAMQKAGKAMSVEAEYDILPESCPLCGVVARLYKHGTKVVPYKDAPAFGKPLVVNVKVKRFRCRECGGTFMQPLPDMHPTRQVTRRLADHLIEQCNSRNYAEMSRETGVDESVVRAICNEEYRKMRPVRRPLAPVILGIDELTLLHQRRCIIVDVGQKRTLDLLPNMGKPSVAHWLSLMQGKERVQVVTMDMWDQYREVVRAVLPRARIVIDKWHIQKKANDALDKVRARHRRGAKTKAGRKNPWRLKRTLLARPTNLRPKALLLLDGLLRNNPLVSDAWHTKERFFDIWEADDRKTAERLYSEWKASIPESVAVEFGAVAKTVENWKGEIFAYFDARYTNAFTEATNGLIKAINRDGRGYRFEAIRAKALNMAHASDGRFVVCECCLGQFPQAPSLGQHLSTAGEGDEATNVVQFCANCHAFHIEEWFKRHGRSTSKTG